MFEGWLPPHPHPILLWFLCIFEMGTVLFSCFLRRKAMNLMRLSKWRRPFPDEIVPHLKGLSHEKLFQHISSKNASGIRWARWKVWKSWFSTLILAFISKSSQLMALKNESVSKTCHWVSGRMSTTCHWDKGRMSTICHSNCKSVQLVTETARVIQGIWWYCILDGHPWWIYLHEIYWVDVGWMLDGWRKLN